MLGVDLIDKRRQNVGCQTRPGSVAGLQDQSDTEVVARPKLCIDGRPDLLPVETAREIDRNIPAIDTERSEVEEMIGQLLDGGCIERLFETRLQVLRDPAVAHPIDPVAIRTARRRHLSLGDLEVGHLMVSFISISIFDPDDHFCCDRTDFVFIVDQIVALPARRHEKAKVDQEVRVDTTSLKPRTGDPVDPDVPDGEQSGHDRHALLIARRATLTEDLPVSKQPMPQNPFEGVVDAEKAARIAVGEREVEGLRLIPSRAEIPDRELNKADCERLLENPPEARLVVDDFGDVLVDRRGKRKSVCEIADAYVGADHLRAVDHHVVEVRQFKIEPLQELRNVIGLKVDGLVGIGLIESGLDEAFGDCVPQLSVAGADMHPPGRRRVDDHRFSGRAEIDARPIAIVIDLPNARGGIGMEQQVHLRRRFIAVLGDVELVDAVAVAAIETLVEVDQKLFEQCAAGVRAPVDRRLSHEGLVVLVIAPVETQVQAVLRRFKQAMLVSESPKATRELVTPVSKFLGAVGFERGSGETLEDVLAAVARDCDDPGCFSLERAQPVLLFLRQHISGNCRTVRIVGVELVGGEPAQPLESLALKESGQQFRLCIVE